MAETVLRSTQEFQDFIRGCTILGVGGGGNPKEGLKALEEQRLAGRTVGWKDISDIPDGGIAICTFLMGSTAPLSDEKLQQMKELGLTQWKYERNLVQAITQWEEYTGQKVSVLVPFELGGSNTPVPMAAAATLGKIVVDGDYAGRAVPEITQTTVCAAGKPFWPVSSVDKYGNICIIKEAISYSLAERLGKFISDVVFGSTGLAGFAIPTEQLKTILVKGTLTRAYQLGKAVREARESGKSPLEAVKAHGGKVLFNGVIERKDWEDREGYYWGTHYFNGVGQFEGHKFKVLFKNENHVSWLDEKIYVTSPDLLANLDPETGEPILNGDIDLGSRVAICGFPCSPQLRSPKLLKVLEPTYFGVQAPYKPIEELV